MQYYSTLKAKLIYIFTIPDQAHHGCVKIGEATLDEATDSSLPPNCKALNQAAKQAYKATYGYEWQGDNLVIARESALYTFFDYYQDKFQDQPTNEQAREIAEIISWNFWQMDGLKGVIPNSCHEDVHVEPSLFGDGEEVRIPCKGCETDDIRRHNGIYCKIMDWETGKPVRFIDLIKP